MSENLLINLKKQEINFYIDNFALTFGRLLTSVMSPIVPYLSILVKHSLRVWQNTLFSTIMDSRKKANASNV